MMGGAEARLGVQEHRLGIVQEGQAGAGELVGAVANVPERSRSFSWTRPFARQIVPRRFATSALNCWRDILARSHPRAKSDCFHAGAASNSGRQVETFAVRSRFVFA
jgi:hypothetical protein